MGDPRAGRYKLALHGRKSVRLFGLIYLVACAADYRAKRRFILIEHIRRAVDDAQG